jgi:glycosyltransferase involved in cell wall biosynthesis
VPAPLVSILLPARDAESTLPACLRSIERQTLVDFECVIVDDGSRDATLRLARGAERRDARFTVLSTGRLGLVAALNAGLERCRGCYVARMDADDLMHKQRLGAQVRALQAAPELSGVGCHVRVFPRSHLDTGLRDYERWLLQVESARQVREEAFVECPLPHPTWVLRRNVLANLGYRDRGWAEDYDLLLRLLAGGGEMGVVPRRLLAWRDASGRLWRTGESYRLDRFQACKAAFLAEGFLSRTDRYVLWGYGETGKALRRALLAHGKEPSHIVELHPGRLGERIHGAPVIPPERLPSLPTGPIVVSVAGACARGEIRTSLSRMGFRELVDFVCAA